MFDSEAVKKDRALVVAELRARVRGMEKTSARAASGLADTGFAAPAALAPLLPGNALRPGSIYSLGSSATLVMAMLAAPSRAGAWSAVVGMPEFGLAAASEVGIRLDRLALLPHPGPEPLSVVSALAEVMEMIVIRLRDCPEQRAIDRISARLRRYGGVLLTTGALVPTATAALEVAADSWYGIGRGHGLLLERELKVRVRVGSGSARLGVLRIPESDAGPEVIALRKTG